jgi:KDO2-lipid IV(A) lauroyltransferase
VKVRLIDRVVYVLAATAITVAAYVPQWLAYGFAAGLGRLYFRLDRRRQRYALEFLRQAFPDRGDRELLRIGRVATGNLCKVPIDMARLTRLLAKGGDLRSVVETTEARAGLAATPPVIGLTPHLGNWEVAAVAMAQHFGGGHCVARVAKNPLLHDWISENRLRGGLTMHPRRGGIRGLARALEKGALGLQAVDQNQRLRGVFAPFFGRIASCERAAVSLALRNDYPVIVGAVLRVGGGFRFRMVMSAPFRFERTGDKAKDLYAAICRVNGHLEALIRSAPEQYIWIHDRYRTQPPPGWRPGDDAGDETAERGGDDGE